MQCITQIKGNESKKKRTKERKEKRKINLWKIIILTESSLVYCCTVIIINYIKVEINRINKGSAAARTHSCKVK